jgi:hypothetical protein
LRRLQRISLALLLSLFLEYVHELAIQRDLLNQETPKSNLISDFLGISLIFSRFQKMFGFKADYLVIHDAKHGGWDGEDRNFVQPMGSGIQA